MININLNDAGRNMESKNKIMFAYPVSYKEDMTKEEMCVPSPFLSGFDQDSVNTIAITVGYSVVFGPRSFILINIYKTGESDEPGDVTDGAHVENLRATIYKTRMGIFLSCFHMDDFEVKDTGFYEIRVQMIKADEHGTLTDEVFDELKTQFFVQVKDKK
ncbi:hypothetical protein B7764_06915 [Pantoea ananatis]|nr:hypothetical protein B7764_06915 [Pantoea ananatis]